MQTSADGGWDEKWKDFVHLEVEGMGEKSGRGVILPPKHELGSWQPPMVEMELLRKRWRFMMR